MFKFLNDLSVACSQEGRAVGSNLKVVRYGMGVWGCERFRILKNDIPIYMVSWMEVHSPLFINTHPMHPC